jgi:hypothetical protein
MPPVTPIDVCRYDDVQLIQTNLDLFADVVTWLEYYAAGDYVTSLLIDRHGVSALEAKRRAHLIVPHVGLARHYVEQAMSGPGDVAFLPAYYAILNLLKVYILFGPYHAQLPNNRWHGATYDVDSRDSQTLLTERIILKKGGALPLFYQTVTGQTVKHNTSVAMADVYPYILDASLEYEFATGKPAKVASLAFGTLVMNKRKRLSVEVSLIPGSVVPKLNQLKPLAQFRRDPSQTSRFISKSLKGLTPAHIRTHLRPFLLYQFMSGAAGAPISGSRLLLPEELPIALAFFHMSSVVRYKPEFLAKLKDSRFWPLLSTVRRHGLFKFLTLFWSFTHQKTLALEP